MGKLVNPSAWHAGDPQFEPGWKQKDVSTVLCFRPCISLPFFPCTSFLFLLLEKSNWWKEIAKDEDVFEDLKFRRQSSLSRWARYKTVPGPGRVSISVSMPACHAGELGSIPRRGGESLPTWSLVVSPVFERIFGSAQAQFREILQFLGFVLWKMFTLSWESSNVLELFLQSWLQRRSDEDTIVGSSPAWGRQEHEALEKEGRKRKTS